VWRYSVVVLCSKGRVCGGGGSGAEDGILEGCVRTQGLWALGDELMLSFASRRKETEAHAQQTAVAKLQLIQKKHAYMRSGCVELRTQAAGEQKKAVAAHRGRDMGR